MGGRRRENLAREVRAGLASTPKYLPARLGSDFRAVEPPGAGDGLPEYHLARAEAEILTIHAKAITARLPRPLAVAEFGPGNQSNAELLVGMLASACGVRMYMPIDDSDARRGGTLTRLAAAHRDAEVRAIIAEYDEGLRFARAVARCPVVAAWMASGIGRYQREEAANRLRALRGRLCPDDRLLLGIDLRKPSTEMLQSYDDAGGLLAESQRNTLRRINQELGGQFDPASFAYRVECDESDGLVRTFLVSNRAQRVWIERADIVADFAKGEALRTGQSYQYAPAEIRQLAQSAGLRVEAQWFDGNRRFSVSLLAGR
ncbi:MAG: L-histidine N(alpha)-methyltransferase [Planctomycetes bacterium]|nr:L-histidine N(alpha)-methyltransferase [Planctomycetota bacterium]